MSAFSVIATVITILLSIPPAYIAIADWRARKRKQPVAERIQSGNVVPITTQSSEATADQRQTAATGVVRDNPWPVPRRATQLAIVGACIVLLAVSLTYFIWWKPIGVTGKDSIVLADFTNQTQDPVFNDSLKQALKVDLQQSPYLNILSDSKVAYTLGLMGRSQSEALTAKVARELCQRANSKAMISGSIANLGEQYVIDLNVTNCATGDSLIVEQARAHGKENILDALDESVGRLRSKLGESLASLRKHGAPIAQVTTASLPALQAYSLGKRLSNSQGEEAGIPYFERAIQLDPYFAMAYADLGTAEANLGRDELAAQNMKKAFELRERVSDRERLHIESHYYDTALADLEKAIPVYKQWIQIYPQDAVPHADLGVIYFIFGQYDLCELEAKQALALEPSVAGYYTNLAGVQISLNRLGEAEATLQQMQTHGLDTEQKLLFKYELSFLRGQSSPMATLAEAGKPGSSDALLFQAVTESYYGRRKNARGLLARIVEDDLSQGDKDGAASAIALGALIEAHYGDDKQARREASRALELSAYKDVHIMAGLALAISGESERAAAVITELRRRSPSDSLLNFYWYPTIQAAIAIRLNNPQAALQVLQSARYGFGQSPPPLTGSAYPPYMRAQALIMSGQTKATVYELRSILDHSTVTVNYPVGALAQLGVARALLRSQDVASAKSAYERFFALWKSADPDIPILRQAKAEYAELR